MKKTSKFGVKYFCFDPCGCSHDNCLSLCRAHDVFLSTLQAQEKSEAGVTIKTLLGISLLEHGDFYTLHILSSKWSISRLDLFFLSPPTSGYIIMCLLGAPAIPQSLLFFFLQEYHGTWNVQCPPRWNKPFPVITIKNWIKCKKTNTKYKK